MISIEASSRFTSVYSDDQLLEAVVLVSRHARPDAPERTTQQQFDDARTAGGHPDCPSARQIAARISRPWREILEVVHKHWADRSRRLGVNRSDRGRTGFSLEQCLNALKLAARTLNRKAITRADYQQAVLQLTAADKRAWRHGHPGRLPTLTQVDFALRKRGLDWKQACRQAGLLPPPTHGMKALGPREAVRAFARELHSTPASVQQLRRWGAARRVSLANMSAQDLADAIKARNRRRAQPLPTAPAALRFEVTDTPPVPGARRPSARGYWNQERIIRGMARASDLLEPGEMLGQRELNRIARENPQARIPRYSVIQRHIAAARQTGDTSASWEAWKAAAIREAQSSDGEDSG